MKGFVIKVSSIFVLCSMLFFVFLSTSIHASDSNDLHIEMDEESMLSDDEMIVSDVMTYDEIVEQMSKDMGITFDEAQEAVNPINNPFSKAVARSNTYRTISSTLSVTTIYKPSLMFYCQTTEGGTFAAILRILNVNMNRTYQNLSKQFSGSVYVNLEDPNRIYYTIDGDFYNNGSTTVGGSVNIPVGQGASITFSVSNSSNHYKNFYVADYRRWPY